MSKVLGLSGELNSLAGALRQSADGLSELFLAVSALFERQTTQLSATERFMAADILKRISKDVEMTLRIKLAEKLADSADAPSELINLLADDRIEVARPVLLRSPVLSDADLLRIIERKGDDHHLAVAGRPTLPESVTAALARSNCEAVLVALLRNEGAKIAEETFQSLTARAKTLEALREPLVGRKDLPSQLAVGMYMWVSAGLKQALSARYPEIGHSLAHAIDETTSNLKSGKLPTPADGAKKLVDKLYAAGQLKPSFLVRTVTQGQMELFEQAFAVLLMLDVEATRNLLYKGNPVTVALACRAAGIDRTVFPTIFHLSRHHRNVATTLSDAESRSADAVFVEVPKNEAYDKVRAKAA